MWNDFKFRDDDIIISTYGKSGTTWMQQIISQLLWPGVEDMEVAAMSPWVDVRVPPKEIKMTAIEEQTHRRFLKTHLPVDALVFSPRAKYIYVARDGRDVAMSLLNHHENANDLWYADLNNAPGRVGGKILPPQSDDAREYFLDWLWYDGYPWWSFWENVRTWWEIRNLPNVLFVHFADLKADMPGEIRRIAEFLDVPIQEDKWDKMLEICSFDYMKAHAAKSVPLGGIWWDEGPKVFVNKGVNGRWHDVLTEEDNEKYECRAQKELGEECAQWLKNGRHLGHE
eukprot:CAMPEP_0183704450 /NCGR_PEP_ID=MMETSP0737-20130205/1771_1 /TAXON_ID=385413 /ORGANISM="Thalassiosira miniscula, Strain CCMP1093" /LENGTH=283 /DNA_ID=CAMNT_0025931313 /DNA_START=118 /DNA_END=969 /DNA_ORIENTATION=-